MTCRFAAGKKIVFILTSSTIDKKLENFEFIFEFKIAINFEFIFEIFVKFEFNFEIFVNFEFIFEFFVNFEFLSMADEVTVRLIPNLNLPPEGNRYIFAHCKIDFEN